MYLLGERRKFVIWLRFLGEFKRYFFYWGIGKFFFEGFLVFLRSLVGWFFFRVGSRRCLEFDFFVMDGDVFINRGKVDVIKVIDL